ncbi:MAG: hypothetical protein ACRC37_07085, partial [Lentisphaeria bacterium]
VERSGKFVNIKRQMEVVSLKKDQFLGIELPQGIFASYIHVKLDNKNLAKFGELQISADGKKWNKIDSNNNGEEMHKAIELQQKIRFVRYLVTSNSPVEIKINQFKIDIPEDSTINSPATMLDGDINTFYSISTASIVPSSIKNGANKVLVVQPNTDLKNTKITVIYNDGSKANYKPDGKNHPKKISGIEITPINNSTKIYEVLFL